MYINNNMSLMYSIETPGKLCQFPANNTSDLDSLLGQEDPRTEAVRRYSYGIVLPAICCLGIVGNVLNLVVLTRKNMRGTAYIYMRANFLQKCKRSDPNLNECLRIQANNLIQNIIHGNENLRIPSIVPYTLPDFEVETHRLYFSWTNCLEYDMDHLIIRNIEMNFDANTLHFIGDEDQSYRVCDYEIRGAIGDTYFNTSGLLKLINDVNVLNYTGQFCLTEINGVSYYQIIDGTSHFASQSVSYDFYQPDGTEDIQAEQLSQLLTENVNLPEYIFPNFSEITQSFLKQMINYVLLSAPVNEIFDP